MDSYLKASKTIPMVIILVYTKFKSEQFCLHNGNIVDVGPAKTATNSLIYTALVFC
jgi:hypothetical protein